MGRDCIGLLQSCRWLDAEAGMKARRMQCRLLEPSWLRYIAAMVDAGLVIGLRHDVLLWLAGRS